MLTNINNRSTSAFDNIYPTMPGYSVGTDSFGLMRTAEDQIHWLYMHFISNVSDIESALEQLKSEITAAYGTADALTLTQANSYTDSVAARLKGLIDNLETSSLDWDVTNGTATDSVTAMRDLFNDVTVHSVTVDDLSALTPTVAELADCGLNVRGVAVFNGALQAGFTPEGIRYDDTIDQKPLTVDILKDAQVKDGFIVQKET